jgi:hypothetical protein
MLTILADSMMVATRFDERKLHDKPQDWDEALDRLRRRSWLRLFRR